MAGAFRIRMLRGMDSPLQSLLSYSFCSSVLCRVGGCCDPKKKLIKGLFTKFYPKFQLTREFLTYSNIIIIWFSLLCLNFSLLLRACFSFSLYV